MVYVMADIHGEYDKYMEMLREIDFSDEDILYILGDIVDRGDKPVEILQDISMRFNVYPVMGNHELMALDILKKLLVEITDDNYKSHIDRDMMMALAEWQANGGETTAAGFRELDKEDQQELLDFMSEFPYYETIDVDDKTFILVHGGLGNYSPDKKLRDYTPLELAFTKLDCGIDYYNDPSVFIVAGHTPTLAITGKAEIYREGNNFIIDCGASYEDGRLACLCLDTMEEFYV